MRILSWCAILLVACSNDSFVDGDASSGGDASLDSATPQPDVVIVDAAPDALDTSGFSAKTVLWLDAADAKTALDAGTVVNEWHDHKQSLTTAIQIGASLNTCVSGLHVTPNAVNGKPAVSFCDAILDITDTSQLQLGNNPFLIEAVIQLPQGAAQAGVLITKNMQGQSQPLPNLSFYVPASGGDEILGEISSSDSAATLTFTQQATGFQFIGFTRNASSAISVRLEGQTGTPLVVTSSDSVSATGVDFEVGGYRFDAGDFQDVFAGQLAELVVLNDSTPLLIGAVEAYFKAKYALP